MSPVSARASRLAWLWRSVADGALIATAVGAVVILLRMWEPVASTSARKVIDLLRLWSGHPIVIGWLTIAVAFGAAFLVASALEVVSAVFPDRPPPLVDRI